MNRKKGHRFNRKGFSLGELLIVVAIIAILAGISVPIFTRNYRNQQIKHVEEQELAAKMAAVAAFYSGYDSKGNKVDISQTGFCTFLYDAENGAVYVSNTSPSVASFESGYSNQIESYGLNIPQVKDYSDEVILVYFDGRYYKKSNDNYYDYDNVSKGTFEEPFLYLGWYSADALVK